MGRKAVVVFFLAKALAASEMDPSLLDETHLINKILKNEAYCVQGYEGNKIFLDPSKVSFSAQGPILDLNGQEFAHLPLIRVEDTRYVLEHGFPDLLRWKANLEEKKVCSKCLEPVDSEDRCRNSQCLFYGVLVEVKIVPNLQEHTSKKTELKGEKVSTHAPKPKEEKACAPPSKDGPGLGAPPFDVALYVDNASIGFSSATPPAGGLIVSGNTSIGASSATSLFNVGSSNQFQVTTTGVASAPQYDLNGSTSGTVSILPQAAAGTYNFNLPIDAGSSGYVLTSAGGGASPMTWTNLGTASVTSITGTANQISASSATGDVTLAFTDGISIGSYQATAPPTGGIICPGNVGIGLTGPTLPLQIEKNLSNTTGVQVRIKNTATTTNSFAAFVADGNNGALTTQFYADGLGSGPLGTPGAYIGNFTSHPIGFFTNNTEKMRIDSAGNVGIGATTVNAPLHILKDLAAYSTYVLVEDPSDPGNGGTTLQVQNAQGNVVVRQYGSLSPGVLANAGGIYSLGGDLILGATTGVGIQMITNDAFTSPRMTITSSGDVGIGVSPSAKLDVFDSSQGIIFSRGSTGTAWLSATSTAGYVGSYTNIPLIITTSNTERIRIDTSGNVGIGTTPNRPLEVSPSIASDYPIRFSRGAGETTYGELISGTNGVGLAARNVSSGFGIQFYVSTGTSDTEAMRIDDAGNVGIGTTSPDFRLSVTTGSSGSQAIFGQDVASGVTQIVVGNTDTSNSSMNIYYDNTNNFGGLRLGGDGTALVVADGGAVGIQTQTPNAGFHVNGSQAFKITVPGAYPYSILTTDYLIAVDTSLARSIVLPTAASGNTGVNYVVKDATGSAGANNITVTVNGGGNIDGGASSTINTNYGSARYYSNGTQWFTW